MSFLDSLKDAMGKIGHGAKFLIEGAWLRLKAVFGPIARDIAEKELALAKEYLKSDLGQFIEAEIKNLENSDMDGPARLAAATQSAKDWLASQGQQLATFHIQSIIQTILIFVRDLAAQ